MITFPRLPAGAASGLLGSLLEGAPPEHALQHPSQVYAPVGERARPQDLRQVRQSLLKVAQDHGYPASASDMVAFDRQAAVALRNAMPVSGSEAATRDMWTWIAFVLLPDITAWRWSARDKVNVERWIARDLTRHTWARLWWQATTFTGHEELLEQLHESELNQIFERREIGGRGTLTVALASELHHAAQSGRASRREIFREVNKRLLRALAYMDSGAMTDDELTAFVRRLTAASVEALEQEGQDAPAPPEVPAQGRSRLSFRGWRGR